MRYILLFLGFIFYSGAYCQTSPSNDTLHWNETHRLAWTDFKGESQDYTGLMGEAFCMTSANFERPSIFSKIIFKVYPIFDRTKSWVKPDLKNDNGLLYFQTMFDLYELHARRLRKELSETKFGADPNPIFQEKYNASMTALTNEFNEFRKETKMGQDADTLIIWKKKVLDSIKLLEAYK